MIIDQNDNNMDKERRCKERRADQNRRASIRFGDALGRREGKDRRANVHIDLGLLSN